MKLTIEIEAPEKDIREAIEAIPLYWLDNPDRSPIRLTAIALREAYFRAKREERVRKIQTGKV